MKVWCFKMFKNVNVIFIYLIGMFFNEGKMLVKYKKEDGGIR